MDDVEVAVFFGVFEVTNKGFVVADGDEEHQGLVGRNRFGHGIEHDEGEVAVFLQAGRDAQGLLKRVEWIGHLRSQCGRAELLGEVGYFLAGVLEVADFYDEQCVGWDLLKDLGLGCGSQEGDEQEGECDATVKAVHGDLLGE